jgi:P4 family phage/plasmid primase-like protien
MGGLCGCVKLNISDDDYDEFILNYIKSFKGEPTKCSILSITEKHKSISPILIDLDFRSTSSTRLYTQDLIINFIEKLLEIVLGYVVIDDDVTEVFVLEKSYPRPVQSHREQLYKDGIHIVLPSIVTSPKYQYAIRNDFIQCYDDFFESVSITPISQVYDEAVIHKNNWFMYGSMKPDETNPWLLTHISSIDRNCKIFNHKPVANPYLSKFVSLLSIRNKKTECMYTTKEIVPVIHTFYDESASHATTNNKPSILTKLDLTEADFETVKALVFVLNKTRADNYNDWIRVGWCLHNLIFYENDDRLYLDLWIEFSKQSPKYRSGECEMHWRKMHDDGLRIGTLHKWAKEDNPQEYEIIVRKNITHLIYSCSHNEFDVAMLVKLMFSNHFVSVAKNKWYVCDEKSNRWVLDNGDALSIKIATDVYNELVKACKRLYDCFQNETESEEKKNKLYEAAKRIETLSKALKTTKFKRNVLSECEIVMRDTTFPLKLDSNRHLLAFINGVVDLNSKSFRSIQPDDFISRYCEYDYISWVDLHKRSSMQSDIQWMFDFFTKIFPNDEVRNWKLQQFAQTLGGYQYTNAFFNEVGTGSNGKTQLFIYLKACFGNYFVSLNVNALIHDHNYNQGDPFLAETLNARIVVASEASENVKYNDGFIKAITGGDTVKVRMLHSNDVITIQPTFMLYLLTNNVPAFNGNDGGMTRRIKITRYTSKFLETAIKDDYKNSIFMGVSQKDLSNRFIQTRAVLMSYLIHIYDNNYKFTTPHEVIQWTKEVIAYNNVYDCFISTCFQQGCDTDFIKMMELKNTFKTYIEWFNKKHYTKHKYNKLAFEEEMYKRVGMPKRGYLGRKEDGKKNQPHTCYMGFKLNYDFSLQDPGDDNDDVDLLEI